MGTLKVDNIQTESGSAIITNGAIPESTLRSSGVGMVKLFSSTSSSGVANFDIDSTYINSTYDNYRMYLGYQTASDNVIALVDFFVGGTEVTANYSYENAALTSSTYAYDAVGAGKMFLGSTQGNATSETGTVVLDLTNVNSTDVATRIHGFQSYNATNANAVGRVFQGGQDVNSYTSVVNGIKFYISSGNIIVKNFALYGVVK